MAGSTRRPDFTPAECINLQLSFGSLDKKHLHWVGRCGGNSFEGKYRARNSDTISDCRGRRFTGELIFVWVLGAISHYVGLRWRISLNVIINWSVEVRSCSETSDCHTWHTGSRHNSWAALPRIIGPRKTQNKWLYINYQLDALIIIYS